MDAADKQEAVGLYADWVCRVWVAKAGVTPGREGCGKVSSAGRRRAGGEWWVWARGGRETFAGMLAGRLGQAGRR